MLAIFIIILPLVELDRPMAATAWWAPGAKTTAPAVTLPESGPPDKKIGLRRSTLPRRLLAGSLAPLEIDVEIHPRMRIEVVFFVTKKPWMNNDVLDERGGELPRGERV